MKKKASGWRTPDLVGLKVTLGGGRYSCKIANWTRAGIYSRWGRQGKGALESGKFRIKSKRAVVSPKKE